MIKKITLDNGAFGNDERYVDGHVAGEKDLFPNCVNGYFISSEDLDEVAGLIWKHFKGAEIMKNDLVKAFKILDDCDAT